MDLKNYYWYAAIEEDRDNFNWGIGLISKNAGSFTENSFFSKAYGDCNYDYFENLKNEPEERVKNIQ